MDYKTISDTIQEIERFYIKSDPDGCDRKIEALSTARHIISRHKKAVISIDVQIRHHKDEAKHSNKHDADLIECAIHSLEYIKSLMTEPDESITCKWRQVLKPISDEAYETGCGNTHYFLDEGPYENRYVFCPYCGKKIEE